MLESGCARWRCLELCDAAAILSGPCMLSAPKTPKARIWLLQVNLALEASLNTPCLPSSLMLAKGFRSNFTRVPSCRPSSFCCFRCRSMYHCTMLGIQSRAGYCPRPIRSIALASRSQMVQSFNSSSLALLASMAGSSSDTKLPISMMAYITFGVHGLVSAADVVFTRLHNHIKHVKMQTGKPWTLQLRLT